MTASTYLQPNCSSAPFSRLPQPPSLAEIDLSTMPHTALSTRPKGKRKAKN